MTKTKLTVEMVPSTSWSSNVRTMTKQKDWDLLRRESYQNAKYKCEICGGVGNRHPVECHEIWEYDDKKKLQILLGLTSLCPSCHQVKHMVLTKLWGREEVAVDHLAKINRWDRKKTKKYVKVQFDVYRKRSRSKWKIDVSWLDRKGIKYNQKIEKKTPISNDIVVDEEMIGFGNTDNIDWTEIIKLHIEAEEKRKQSVQLARKLYSKEWNRFFKKKNKKEIWVILTNNGKKAPNLNKFYKDTRNTGTKRYFSKMFRENPVSILNLLGIKDKDVSKLYQEAKKLSRASNNLSRGKS